MISATPVTNKTISANTEFFSIVLQQSEEFSNLGVNAAKVFSETSKEVANSGLFHLESAESRQKK